MGPTGAPYCNAHFFLTSVQPVPKPPVAVLTFGFSTILTPLSQHLLSPHCAQPFTVDKPHRPAASMADRKSKDDSLSEENELGDGILNRKREHKGLPSSFSMNLGRRATPPHSIHTSHATPADGTGRSVKSIVAWIEASPSATTPSKITRSHTSKANLSGVSSPDYTSQSIQQNLAAADVEEYSLTLLKYRKYFTQQPLGRCLDERTEVAPTQVRHHNSNESSPSVVCRVKSEMKGAQL